ncbi:cobalamin biosynthesis protein CobD [Mesobaculum littorinae]|uniref:Cobalamin biosynthesis protein CobD n=1 Tax=Mesobaculum littorinae TaxID=2486419 RepID=A0A438AFC7_9RHOB|nr:adenosylcobinamide-phosphate synthase CbiB [Mesobaculum littorinae]RVV97411.1 cobalamin biosynthesis protein CobD [Mesobaculum littorinae]
MILDAALGEPDWMWRRWPHPAVLMGRAIGRGDAWLNRGRHRRARGATLLGALCLTAWVLADLVEALPLGPLPEAIAGAILLAQRSLCDHVAAVAMALRRSTSEARGAVAMIVGRDTAGMQDPDIARAAIESGAENFSDGVIAPAFWFLLLGLPGIAVYKMVNTADSMIGYRTPRHEAFGWAAARLDDVLNWVPARLTALIFATLGRCLRDRDAIASEARRHRSPNAGWPEAALARALGVALSGPRSYHGRRKAFPFVNPRGRHDAGPEDIDAAMRRIWQGWAVALAVVGALALV